ncbi:MAG: signal recognition particle-docking protein FtsY [Clostridia bacterium]|nr:signal recognition particle-docking protein FtsY [Clostridia bacterium]
MLFWKKKKEQIEEAVEEIVETVEEKIDEIADAVEEKIEELGDKIEEVTDAIEDKVESVAEEIKEEIEAPEEEKKGFFARLRDGLGKTRTSISDKVSEVFKSFKKIDEDFYEELEEALILADLGMSTSLEIVERLRERVKEKKLTEEEEVRKELRDIVADILRSEDSKLKLDTTPTVVLVIGVNGVGKTTTIGKLASRLKKSGKEVVLAAADTFRAAAADQLEIWAERNDVRIVRLQEGADPAAVIFDGCVSARSKGADVLICDTAGRLHNKKNLMDELGKIYRVIERELPGARKEVLLVLDATTGQNAVNQAEEFNNAANITGIVLTKLDGTAKGGIVITIREKLGIPVKFVGVGEGIDDLQEFDADSFADALFY